MRIDELAGKRVAIWGFGREGRATLVALRKRVPDLVPTVFCSEAEALDIDAPTCTAPPTAADLSAFDVVIKSPGISAYRVELLDARRNGTRFTSATALWFAENPLARVIAVTGTKGKSTTTALIAHLLRSCGRRVALAGNIGMPLLELLDAPQAPEWWVVELSSFQTRDAGHADIGLVTNLEEEHLDWHGDRDRYVEDKLALSTVSRLLVIDTRQPELAARCARHPQCIHFGDADGWHVTASSIARGDVEVLVRGDVPLPGLHNATNVCAALTVLEAAGEDAVAAAKHVRSFRPLPHRLQTLGTIEGVLWIDDSIATTPQAALEALRSVDPARTCLIIGGHDRGLDWHAFAQAVREVPPRLIVCNGASAARIAAILHGVGGAYSLRVVATLADAVAAARDTAHDGDTILLSPGAPSFDQFRDYTERGRAFATLGGFDPDLIGRIEGLGIA